MQKPELLIPAGNLEKLRTALIYGADAVYVGVPGLSLRSSSAEMSIADLATGVTDAHARRAKVYAALNTFARDADLKIVEKTVPELIAAGVDALIVSDPGLIRIIRRSHPTIPLHLSTQANTTNIEAVRFWRDQGIQRIILAREMNLLDIGKIVSAAPEMELEIFVHGAMCMAYSGRCYLSAFRNRRSANEGDCSQPCRWEYLLTEATRLSDPLILQDDERFTYLLSSKDLCLIEYLPEVLATGVKSVKIEGRMKSSYYVAVVTRAYRRALDELADQNNRNGCDPRWLAELKTVSYRGYTTGFAFSTEKICETSPDIKNIQTHEPVGIVLDYEDERKQIRIEVRNRLSAGDSVELLLPGKNVPIDTRSMVTDAGNAIDQAHAGQQIYLSLPFTAPKGVLLRRAMKQTRQ